MKLRFNPLDVGWRIGDAHEPRGGELWVPWDRTAGVIGPQGSGKTLDLLLFDALRPRLQGAALLALEVRDPALVNVDTARLLKQHGVRWCLGLHDRMPDVAAQLEMLRRTWPGDLVCRWNLQRGQRYAQARDRWAPFDRMQAPDLATRQALARAIAGTLGAGQRAFVTINNKAEGSAPASVVALAREMLA